MSKSIKEKIHKLVDEIDDEVSLHQLMEDAAFYASKKDVVDDLTAAQLAELDAAVAEADKGETIDWDDFKKEMNEWRKK